MSFLKKKLSKMNYIRRHAFWGVIGIQFPPLRSWQGGKASVAESGQGDAWTELDPLVLNVGQELHAANSKSLIFIINRINTDHFQGFRS